MEPRTRWRRIALCAIVAAILYLPALGRPALWEPDEGRYAEIAREMVLSSDYITPRDDYLRYFEKPPLVYWSEAAAIKFFGANEFAVRLPAAIFSIGEVVLVYVIGDAMFGATAGLLAALALALMPLVFGFARFATLDPALAFFITAALGAFYAASEGGDFDAGSGRLWMLCAAAMLALGTLCKGPVALALGGGIAVIWFLLERRGRDILRMPLLTCAILYLAIAVPWFAIAELRSPGFLKFFFVHEHLERFVSSTEHGWGPWFFIPIVIVGGWPWLFFIPLGIREISNSPENDRLMPRLRLLIVWFAVIFVFFSIPRSKLGTYILPAMPPLAIAAGYGLSRLGALGRDRLTRTTGVFAAINVAAGAAAIVAFTVTARRLPPGVAACGAIIAAAIAIAAVVAFAYARAFGRADVGVAAVTIAMLIAIGASSIARADAAPYVSYRRLARAVEPYLNGSCILGSYRHYVQSLPFYTGRREVSVEYWGELGEFADPASEPTNFIGGQKRLLDVWAGPRCFVLVADRKDLPALAGTLTPAPSVIACEGKKVALYNRPDPAPAPDCVAAGR